MKKKLLKNTLQTPAYYFHLIEKNHKKYLKENMVTHLEMMSDFKNLDAVNHYAEKIESYYQEKKRELVQLIQPISNTKKIGYGALSALTGMGTAAIAHYIQQGLPLAPKLNPLAGAIQSTFSTAIGLSVGYFMYQALSHAPNDITKNYGTLQAALQKAGFNEQTYLSLANQLVTLFHFRECLLDKNNDMHKVFKNKYQLEKANDQALNQAVEVHFLKQLDILFKKAFENIYDIQHEEIEQASQEYKIIAWLKSYFQKPQAKEQFTQQIQLEFMNQCVGYLRTQMNEPSFFAQHPYITASVTGLIGGAIALGLSVAILGGPITGGIAAIALVVACVAAVAAYFALTRMDGLKYKRNKNNRSAIQQTIDDVMKECERLSHLIDTTLETTQEDVNALGDFKDLYTGKGGFWSYFNPFKEKNKNIAMGVGKAWIREYAARYRHNQLSEIDLKKIEEKLIVECDQQTQLVQKALNEFITSQNPVKIHEDLKNFIEHTQDYLQDFSNENFIEKFQLREKIKQQVLEIVAGVPYNAQNELPQELVAFYIMPINQGGLGGLEQDLHKARELAPILSEDIPSNKLHPYNNILRAAMQLDSALSRCENAPFVFRGDTHYRAMLNMQADSGKKQEQIEYKINGDNIEDYLNESLHFLYSLNKPIKLNDLGKKSKQPLTNSDAFILYRTLFIKQLAHLADPMNQRVDIRVRQAIEKFAKEKLLIDPKVVFNEILNQALFLEEKNDSNEGMADILEENVPESHRRACSFDHLAYIAEAMRLDLALVSKQSITPHGLIQQEIDTFLTQTNQHENGPILFGYKNFKNQLKPCNTEAYSKKISDAIAMTKLFLLQLENNKLFKQLRINADYVITCIQEITDINSRIKTAKSKINTGESDYLKNAEEQLNRYLNELNKQKEDLNEIYEKELKKVEEHLQKNKPKKESLEQQNNEQSPRINEIPLNNTSNDDKEDKEEISLQTNESRLNSIIVCGIDYPKSDDLSASEIQEIKQNTYDKQIIEFIKALKEYQEELKKEPENNWFFNRVSYSKAQKYAAVEKLMQALINFQEDNKISDNLTFLDEKIYQNGRLGKIIQEHLNKMRLNSQEIKDLKDLFATKKALIHQNTIN